MATNERIQITTGTVDGVSYVLFSSGEPPVVNGFTYSHLDIEINRMKRKRRTCKVPPRVYSKSPWTDWLETKKKNASDYSISEYKRLFGGKLPYYALDFSDRKIDSVLVDYGRYKVRRLLPKDSRNHRFWRIERELLIPEKNIGKYVVVERVFGSHGHHNLNEVTLINLSETRGLLTIHQEDNLGHGVWKRTSREVDDERFVGKTWPTFRDLPEKWSTYF